MTDETTLPKKKATSLWTWLVAPVLAAMFPVVSVYASSLDEANLSDAVVSGIIIAVGTIVVANVIRLFCHSKTRAGLASLLLVASFFSFAGYIRFGRFLFELLWSSTWTDYILLFVWTLLILVVLHSVLRMQWNERRLAQFHQFLQLAIAFSFAILLLDCMRGYFHFNSHDTNSKSIWASDAEAMSDAWKPRPPVIARDFYFIIFDRYANADVLKNDFGFDNSAFYAELEKRGFVVDRHAAASYPMTAPSMASTLNMRYLDSHFINVVDFFEPVEVNEVAKLFAAAGYKYHYFGNVYAPLRTSRLADWNMRLSCMPTEFADALVGLTPLRPLIGRQYKRRLILSKFDQLAQLAENPALTFAYAHFLVPHPPYVFAADGSSMSEWSRTTRSEPQLYVEQLLATNALALSTIDRILAASPTKPVIILQADEGPYLMPGDEKLSREQQIAKRTGILNAILIPDDDIRGHVPKHLLPVNTFRFLFKEYFAAPLSLLPNQVFYWEDALPTGLPVNGTRIVKVDNSVSKD